ncbi:hypothetical protein K2173_000822 [Erythroxylum novogranatense]|uniref:[Histone H3]-lysine(27) N-trimethyltransferase n=1 Tax=Erythroxylum novogranatense TaxID=1862640 RepID=A0AAV8S886_9ROSI|nr:hypothetical protein K2173_000822 [Erythroxylum novogranatense]
MVLKSTDSASKLRKSHGEHSNEVFGNLSYKMNQLKKQIQSERVVSVKEKFEKNRNKLEIAISNLLSEISSENTSLMGQNSVLKVFCSRTGTPLCKYGGFTQGSGDKDYINGHEVSPITSNKLPYIEKIPPYTTWMFLDRNQRMAEDQSVVGRRRIYYDQHGSEALICSDSEEELVEAEEEKHEFSEGEDRILWMVFQEHGLAEEALNVVSQFIGVSTSELMERCSILKEKYDEEQNVNDSGDSGSYGGISLDKSLNAALDSFDNLFCRRCLVFDCRLHGCSQTLINPSEKQPYWSEYEDDRKPCSDHCCLQLRIVKDLPDVSVKNTLFRTRTSSSEQEKESISPLEVKDPAAQVVAVTSEKGKCISDEKVTVTSEANCDHETTCGVLSSGPSVTVENPENTRKRKVGQYIDVDLDELQLQVTENLNDSSSKKQKKHLTLNVVTGAPEGLLISTDKTATHKSDIHMDINKAIDSLEKKSTDISPVIGEGIRDETKSATEVPNLNQSSSIARPIHGILSRSEWKPIEKELYLKGVEMFGKNSCLIARNLLCGLKTCIEVSRYMCDSGSTMLHRSIAPSSYIEDSVKTDTDCPEQEVPTRSRILRRRGRNRKLKYSWKSAGHPSIWKRIADGKNQSCKQYTPCGCRSMCGKQCPCLDNGTCCEKYCGCSKSCKNRFRGCHCAKSQCRSRQCPCFAAGRECDPDVCRNCWVSCGDGSLGEPPRRGDGQCGNMRLLLRQQQRILLAKSDVAGWGAFLKNPVNKNDYLGEYTGELISHREADKRGKIYDRANSSFLFDLNDQYVLDAYRKGDKLKFANHSSDPNCYAKVMLVAGDHRVGIFAKERIEASEELFYDYRYGPDQAPAWARKPEGSKRDESTVPQGRAKKHQWH